MMPHVKSTVAIKYRIAVDRNAFTGMTAILANHKMPFLLKY